MYAAAADLKTTAKMTLPGAINYRHCCLLLVLVSFYHATFAITIIGHESKEHGAEDRSSIADDTHLEKAEDEEAEDKHFMDVYSLQSGPQQLEFGHVFEDPNVWEQRYEKKDFDTQRYQGKVKWGDKDGGYGEQYWDLNHSGAVETTDDNKEDEPYDKTTPIEYYGQESRRRATVYTPMVIKLIKNKSKKPVRNIRNNNSKRPVLDPSTTTRTVAGTGDKKKAPVLVFDMKTGVVMDEATGNKFILQPLKER